MVYKNYIKALWQVYKSFKSFMVALLKFHKNFTET